MFKCENCKIEKEVGDDVFFVNGSKNNVIPTCSISCAESIKQIEISKLEKRINEIKNAEIKKYIW